MQRILDVIRVNAGNNHVVFPNDATESNYVVLLDGNGGIVGAVDQKNKLDLSRRGMFSHYADVYTAATRKGVNDLVRTVRSHDGEFEKWVHDYTVSTLAALARDYDAGHIANEHGTNEALNDTEQLLFVGVKPVDNDTIRREVEDELGLVDDATARFPVSSTEFDSLVYHNDGNDDDGNQETDEEVLVNQAGRYGISVGSLPSFANGFLMSHVYKVVFDEYTNGKLDIIGNDGKPVELTVEPPYTDVAEVDQTKLVEEQSMLNQEDYDVAEAAINGDTIGGDDYGISEEETIDADDLIDIGALNYGDADYVDTDDTADDDADADSTVTVDDGDDVDDDDVLTDWDVIAGDDDGDDDSVVEVEQEEAVGYTVPALEPVTTDVVAENNDSGSVRPFQRVNVDTVSDDEVSGLVSAVRRATNYTRALTDENNKLNERIESMTNRDTGEVEQDIRNTQSRINGTQSRIDSAKKEIESLKAKMSTVEAEVDRLESTLTDDSARAAALRAEYKEAQERDRLTLQYHKNQRTLDELRNALN